MLITIASSIAYATNVCMRLLPPLLHASPSRGMLLVLHIVGLICEACALVATGLQLVAADEKQ